MRNYFSTLILIALAIVSVSAHSETLAKDAIPEKVMDQIYKKHPNAVDIAAEQTKHFNQDLYKIKFKDGEENRIKFYRANGQFVVNGVKIDTSENTNMLPPAGNNNLKSEFTQYDITDAIMIVNPNGSGEDYDLMLTSEGVSWRISMDQDGKLITKERN